MENRFDRPVMVTGGAGFIGSELVSQLVAAGVDVTVVDNFATGRRENLATLPPGSYRLLEADIRERHLMKRTLQRMGVVFHLACLGVRHSIHSPRENHDVNATCTLDLLQSAREVGVDRFVHVSSSEIYGTARVSPMTEDHPIYPTTVYGGSKLAGECYARAYHSTYGFPTVVVRPFNAYGPRSHHEGDTGEVIPKFVLRCLAGRPMVIFGDGRQTRDFTFVSDIARGILAAGTAPNVIGETINIGSGRSVTINDLAHLVAKVAGRPDARIEHDAPRPGDVHDLCANSDKAKALLGFDPRVALEDGLGQLLAWYHASGKPADVLLQEEVARNWDRLDVRS
jgi:UDP-glucose 4-epimerase